MGCQTNIGLTSKLPAIASINFLFLKYISIEQIHEDLILARYLTLPIYAAIEEVINVMGSLLIWSYNSNIEYQAWP